MTEKKKKKKKERKRTFPWLVLEATYKRGHKETWRAAQNGKKMRQEWKREKSLPFIMVEMRYLNLTSISYFIR